MIENQKICKIIEEFSLYLLEANINMLDISIKRYNNKTLITFICESIDDINEITSIFSRKRQHEYELYGWELIGQGDADEHELMLVNNLIDYYTYYYKDERIYFNFVRYE